MMAVSKQFVEFVVEQLHGVHRLTSRRVFGGVGLYSDGVIFGVIFKDRLYFKTDDESRREYVGLGMEGFQPRPDKPRLKMKYYTVPADVLEDGEVLLKWARRALLAATARK
jgi:DNA transformation protein